MLVFDDAFGHSLLRTHQTPVAQTLQRPFNVALGVIGRGRAVRLLVAGKDEGVDRQRIVVRGGALFLEQCTQNADIEVGQAHQRSLANSGQDFVQCVAGVGPVGRRLRCGGDVGKAQVGDERCKGARQRRALFRCER